MMSLEELSLWIGGVYIVLHLPLVAAPQMTRKLLKAFPRNFWAGVILTGIALIWSAYAVYDMPLGAFIEEYKWVLWGLTPAIYALILAFMNELLAPRALGGLLLLVANPVLSIQCLYSTRFTWGIAALAYVWIVGGIILVLSPYRFRQVMEKCVSTDFRCRWAGILGVAVGIGLMILGFTVFKGAD
ncbi:MAG: hypothetical protein WCO42_06100 [bacterium]